MYLYFTNEWFSIEGTHIQLILGCYSHHHDCVPFWQKQIKDIWYVLWNIVKNNKHILILRPYYPNIIRSSTVNVNIR